MVRVWVAGINGVIPLVKHGSCLTSHFCPARQACGVVERFDLTVIKAAYYYYYDILLEQKLIKTTYCYFTVLLYYCLLY